MRQCIVYHEAAEFQKIRDPAGIIFQALVQICAVPGTRTSSQNSFEGFNLGFKGSKAFFISDIPQYSHRMSPVPGEILYTVRLP
ncbi:MAG: hypothetical protein R2861_02820 [Desulfobacterales bacterium]